MYSRKLGGLPLFLLRVVFIEGGVVNDALRGGEEFCLFCLFGEVHNVEVQLFELVGNDVLYEESDNVCADDDFGGVLNAMATSDFWTE
eukprot:10731537-Ditylum_brightwellii.AAC.1